MATRTAGFFVGFYSGICELRGRAALGKGCTARASTPSYCALRNKLETTGVCTSVGINIDDLPELGQGDLFANARMVLLSYGGVTLRPAILLAGTTQCRINATGNISALMVALSGTTAASLSASGAITRSQTLGGSAALVLMTTGTAQAGNGLSGNTQLGLATTGTFKQTVLMSGAATLAMDTTGTVSASKNLSGAADLYIDTIGDATFEGATGGTTWSLTDKAAGYSLANNNRTVTYGATANGVARASADKAVGSGMFYFEVLVDNVGNAPNLLVGMSDSSLALNTFLGGTTRSISYTPSGTIFYNNKTVLTQVSFTTGDVIGVCIDTVSSPPLAYFSKNGVFGFSDPVAGTGGIALPNMTSFFPAVSTNRVGAAATINTGPSTAYAPPSGFVTFDS